MTDPEDERPAETRPDGKAYPGEHLTVTFDGARCLHAAECVRRLPAVFDVTARPWIRPDAAPAHLVVAVVRACPSGALQYSRSEESDEEGPEPTLIHRSAAGRFYVHGRLMVTGADAAIVETRAILCGCGASQNTPYCDASGPCAHEPIGTSSSRGDAEYSGHESA